MASLRDGCSGRRVPETDPVLSGFPRNTETGAVVPAGVFSGGDEVAFAGGSSLLPSAPRDPEAVRAPHQQMVKAAIAPGTTRNALLNRVIRMTRVIVSSGGEARGSFRPSP